MRTGFKKNLIGVLILVPFVVRSQSNQEKWRLTLEQSVVPIVFYGKVVNQFGLPVSDANIVSKALGFQSENSPRLTSKTDSKGEFSVKSAGSKICVEVSKEGYFTIFEDIKSLKKSSDCFTYKNNFDNHPIHKPNKNLPTLFGIYQLKEDKLKYHIREKSIPLDRNGEPKEFTLDQASHKIKLTAWTYDNKKTDDSRFEWSLVIEGIDAELQVRPDFYEFDAPEKGYTSIQKIEMPLSLKRPSWSDDVERSYWIHFKDNMYGVLYVRMIAGGAHFAIVSGHVYQRAGRHKLEHNPSPQGRLE